MRIAALAAAAAAALVLTSAASARTVVVLVRGGATGHSTSSCFLVLRSRLVGGGSETYCLRTFHGAPGRGAVVQDAGTMTFAWRDGTLRAEVRVVQRFAADGAHARQSLRGAVTGGTGRYRGARGTISGGGALVERPAARVVTSDLRYVLRLR